MFIIFVLMVLPDFSPAKVIQFDFDVHIKENQRCKFLLQNLKNNKHAGWLTSVINFEEIKWTTNKRGKKRGYLKSSDEIFMRNISKSLNDIAKDNIRPTLLAYCYFDVEIPGVTEKKYDITSTKTEIRPDVQDSDTQSPDTGQDGLTSCHIVKEFESRKIPEHIIDRPPANLPPEVVYDVVYSHRVQRFSRLPRYLSMRHFTRRASNNK